nr:hypothetical protein [Tanacetum cinerariifolium]
MIDVQERSSGPVFSRPGRGVHAGAAGDGLSGGIYSGKHPEPAVARFLPALVCSRVRTRRLHSVVLQQPDSGSGRGDARDADCRARRPGDHPLSVPGPQLPQRAVSVADHHPAPGAGRGDVAPVRADGCQRQFRLADVRPCGGDYALRLRRGHPVDLRYLAVDPDTAGAHVRVRHRIHRPDDGGRVGAGDRTDGRDHDHPRPGLWPGPRARGSSLMNITPMDHTCPFCCYPIENAPWLC